MGAGPTPQQLAALKRRVKARMVREVAKLIPEAVALGSTITYAGRRAVVDTRIIRASNGEAAGWAIASVFREGGSVVRSWSEAPWMPGGCTPESVASELGGSK